MELYTIQEYLWIVFLDELMPLCVFLLLALICLICGLICNIKKMKGKL